MSRLFNFEIFTRSRISWIYVVLLISAIWYSLSISKLDSVFISSVYLHQNCRFFPRWRWSTTFHDFSNVFSGFLSHRRCYAIYSWIYFHTYTDLASLSILHSIVNFDFPVRRSARKRFLASRQSTVVRCLTLVRDPTTCPSIYPRLSTDRASRRVCRAILKDRSTFLRPCRPRGPVDYSLLRLVERSRAAPPFLEYDFVEIVLSIESNHQWPSIFSARDRDGQLVQWCRESRDSVRFRNVTRSTCLVQGIDSV